MAEFTFRGGPGGARTKLLIDGKEVPDVVKSTLIVQVDQPNYLLVQFIPESVDIDVLALGLVTPKMRDIVTRFEQERAAAKKSKG